MISIIIPAHNEEKVICRLLSSILEGAAPDELEIVVVCNGCSDATAEVSRSFGANVHVIETAAANKAGALNLGDARATAFPRFYVDADVIITLDHIRKIADRLMFGDVLAASPSANVNTHGASKAVKYFYRAIGGLPSAKEGMGTSGVYALSSEGRSRFANFPDLIADDTFVRAHFQVHERVTLDEAQSLVFAPQDVRSLVAIKTRAYAGNYQLSRLYGPGWRGGSKSNATSLLQCLLQPNGFICLLTYCYVVGLARIRASLRSTGRKAKWDRDLTSRQ